MPGASIAEIKDKFTGYKDMLDLESNERHRKKIEKLLDVIVERQNKGERISMMELRKQGFGPNFLYAAREWLESRGYIEILRQGRSRQVQITKKGRKEFIALKSLQDFPDSKKISFKIDQGDKQGQIEVNFNFGPAEKLPESEKYAMIRNPLYPLTRDISRVARDFIHAVRTRGGMKGPINGEIKISIKGAEIDKEISHLLREMLTFYFGVATKGRAIFLDAPEIAVAPETFRFSSEPGYSMPLMEIEYDNYWIEREKKAKRQIMKSERADIDKYIPDFLIKAVKKRKIREWIIRRLEKNPDFFMPRIFWGLLGFKVPELDLSKPPSPAHLHLLDREFTSAYDTEVVHPAFWNVPFLHALGDALLSSYDRHGYFGDDKRLYVWGAYDTFSAFFAYEQTKPEFYEFWKLCRLELLDYAGKHEKFLYRVEPIEEAFLKYLKAKKPVVDLSSAYLDLDRGKELSDVIEAIRRGEYRL